MTAPLEASRTSRACPVTGADVLHLSGWGPALRTDSLLAVDGDDALLLEPRLHAVVGNGERVCVLAILPRIPHHEHEHCSGSVDPRFQSALAQASTRVGTNLDLDAVDASLDKLAANPATAGAVPQLRSQLALARKTVAGAGTR